MTVLALFPLLINLSHEACFYRQHDLCGELLFAPVLSNASFFSRYLNLTCLYVLFAAQNVFLGFCCVLLFIAYAYCLCVHAYL